jgi:competence protein ComEC
MYRAKLVAAERPEPGDVALRARDWFSSGVRKAIPEPEASLGVGYLVGERRSLPDELDKALKAAGLTHVVVASGYNLTILVGVARRLFVKVSKFLAAFFSSGMIIGFIAVTGMSPSMSRAGLVTALSLLAWYYGRRFHPVVLLLLAAAITLLFNPAYGHSDLGWQLSFASFAGVLIVAPLLQNYFYGEEKPSVVRQVLGETISAWLCTVPLIVLAFGQFSNVAIIANLLILPLVPLAMLLTFAAGVGALLAPPLALFIGFPALVVLGYMTRTATYLGDVSWAQTELTITPVMMTIYYLALIAACGYLWRKTRYNFVRSETELASAEQ